MYKSLIHSILFLCLTLLSIPLSAQVKYEKESRIKEKDVPIQALQFIETLALNKKIKWFKEEALKTNSFEAKFKLDQVRYSIEFDTLGAVEDVEIEEGWAKVKGLLRADILESLKKDCLNYRIEKFQIQYSGKTSELLSLFSPNGSIQKLQVRYEIVVRCKKKDGVNLYEYLFDQSGEMLSVSKVIFKNSSHLEY